MFGAGRKREEEGGVDADAALRGVMKVVKLPI